MLDESVAYHVADLNVRWERRAFRLKRRRIVEPNRHTRGVLERWAQRWANRNGHVLQPELEVVYISDTGDYFVRNQVALGVSWRYIEGGRAVLGNRSLVVAPGVRVLRVPYLTEDDKARQSAWLAARGAEDDEEIELD